MSEPIPGSRPDVTKLIYSAKLLYLSAGLFAVAGAIWLVSGNNAGIGVMFLGLALAMAAIGRTLSART